MQKIVAIFIFLVLVFSPNSLFAQENVLESAPNQTIASTTNLALISVNPKTANILEVAFNKPVQIDSVRVTIENQATREMFTIKNYSADARQNVILAELDREMPVSTAYRLTVNTATATDGNSISMGVDAIREFVTPAVFYADVIEKTEIAPTVTPTPVVQATNNSQNTPSTVVSAEAPKTSTATTSTGSADLDAEKVLPATGLEFTIFLLVAAIIGAMLMVGTRKKSNY